MLIYMNFRYIQGDIKSLSEQTGTYSDIGIDVRKNEKEKICQFQKAKVLV